MKQITLMVLLISCLIFSQRIEERKDLKKFFDEYKHDGSFVMFDLKKDLYIKYNPKISATRFIPASTFKIFNSLVGLETGAVKDEKEIMKWDGEKRMYNMWNQDHDMVSAFKYSAVWYYQELARRIGEEKMQHYISVNHYGNENISGGIDRFWLDGELKISADEQIEFLKNIYHNQVKFSQRSIDILKNVMVYEKTDQYVISAKTGWALRVKDQVGWFVGYVEKDDNVYFFALNIQTEKPEEGFVSRKEISFKILKELEIL